jgi:hypothetical protein
MTDWDRIARCAVEAFMTGVPPFVSEERKATLRQAVYDAVMSALCACAEWETASGPRPLTLFCTRCMRTLRFKAKHAGKRRRCPACGTLQKLEVGWN